MAQSVALSCTAGKDFSANMAAMNAQDLLMEMLESSSDTSDDNIDIIAVVKPKVQGFVNDVVHQYSETEDVFLMIRRKKLTIFTDAKDTTSVQELKRIIEGILKVPPNNQQLFNKDNQVMEDDKTLSEYGLTSTSAKAQNPAPVGLAVRQDNGDFENLDLTPFSAPPDLPDVMKTQESNGQEAPHPQ